MPSERRQYRMLKAFKYRLYPTESQKAKLSETLWLCSILYNMCLAERRDCWELGGHSVTKYDQIMRLPELKKIDERFNQVHSQVLQDVVKRLDKTFDAFFRRVKTGEKPGYPRFKPARRYNSFTYPQAPSGCQLQGGKLVLSKIGTVKVKLHREVPGKVKTVTIMRQADGWYACFSCEVERNVLPVSGKTVGVDLGLSHFAITSDEEFFPAAKHLRKAERNLKHLQRQVSRRTKGSNRRKKAVRQLAKAHLRVANQRKDTAHKVARSLVNRYQTIAVEDLQVRNMVKNHHLAKSISDAGWNLFINILMSKAAEAGREVVKVDPRYTSQVCSECGTIVPKPLSQRWHSCTCGCELHRDVNAARNILRRAVA
jgi:putative transposase